jgi:uncharacterized protein YacL
MKSSWAIRCVRAIFFVLLVVIGMMIANSFQWALWLGALSGAGFACVLLGLDSLLARFSLRDFSYGTFGLLIGLFCAWLVTRIGFLQLAWFQSGTESETVRNIVEILVYVSLAFFGVTFALRSDRDQFAFLIPYVRFRRDASEGEPILTDTNVIIDGRIPGVVATGFLSGTLVVPRFVLDELQRLADSHEPLKAERGKRGLGVVEKMREMRDLDLTIHEDLLPSDAPVDTRLVNLARELNARLLTNDENLVKVARVRGVTVLCLNDLALALQPQLAPGDELDLSLVKPGKDRHQAVGYLADGSMIVVNHAVERIGQTVPVVISSTLPTSAGRLVFAELK